VLLLTGFFFSNSLLNLLRLGRAASGEDPDSADDFIILQILRVFAESMLIVVLALPLVYGVFRVLHVDSLQRPTSLRGMFAIGICATICCLISSVFVVPGVIPTLLNLMLTPLSTVLLSKQVPSA
jgi:uncharacterized membrane protein YecN with MAPEG domain